MAMRDTSSTRRKLLRAFAVATGVFCSVFGGANAQDSWPQRAITIVVPTPAGGSADVLARDVAQRLSERLKQPVLVDNKPGAGGVLGVELVARARPDGYTIAMASSSVVLATAVDPKSVRFDISKDLIPLTMTGKIPMLLAAANDAPYSNFREFVAYAKANPGKVSVCVTPGLFGTAHVLVERIKLEMGVDVVPVPYKGSGPAMLALGSGEIQVCMDNISGVGQMIGAGKAKALALMTAQRNPLLPNAQTIAEQGFPDLVVETWNGFMVPAKTPPEITKRLERELVDIMREPAIVARVKSLGQEPVSNSGEEFGQVIRTGLTMWTRVIRQANLKVTQ